MSIINTLVILLNIAAYTPGKIVSNRYTLGPGDELLVVSKSTGLNVKTRVTPEGNVPLYSIIPSTQNTQPSQFQLVTSGIIKATGLTIKAFEDSLSVFSLKKLGKKDSFRVILIKPRNVAIEINGAVIHPGIYILPANSTVADAIWASGGLNGSACFSGIKLIKNHDTATVNLSTYKNLKDPAQNPSISGIDEIVVPQVQMQQSVYVAGDILSPPLSTPILMPLASDTSLLNYKTEREIKVATKAVSIEIDSATTLKKLLSHLLPVELDAKIRENNVFIKRKGDIFGVKDPNVEVHEGDSIYILPIFRGILVAGEVMRPGTFVPFIEGASIEYYVARAGGKTNLAGSTEIIRGFKALKTTSHTIPQDGDIIIVKYSKTKRFAEYVAILQGVLTLSLS